LHHRRGDCRDKPINHAAKQPETYVVAWHYIAGCGTPGDQRVPKVPTEFVRTRAQSWRRDIVQARIKLAAEDLTYNQRTELWQVVDCREWCLKMLVQDFPAELEQIDREIEDELRR
jgi:hypothetical protein